MLLDEQLPGPLLVYVLQFIDPQDLIVVQKSCSFLHSFIKANYHRMRQFWEAERMWICWRNQALYLRSKGNFFLPGKVFNIVAALPEEELHKEPEVVISDPDSGIVVEGVRVTEQRLNEEFQAKRMPCRRAWDCTGNSDDDVKVAGTLARHLLSRFKAVYTMIDVDDAELLRIAPFLRHARIVDFSRIRSQSVLEKALELMNVKRMKLTTGLGEGERLRLSPSFFRLPAVKRMEALEFDEHHVACGLDDPELIFGLSAIRVSNFFTTPDVIRALLRRWATEDINVMKAFHTCVPRQKVPKHEEEKQRNEFFASLVREVEGGQRWDKAAYALMTVRKEKGGQFTIFCSNADIKKETFFKVKLSYHPEETTRDPSVLSDYP